MNINTSLKTELVDITQRVQKVATESKIKEGVVFIFVPHTTAGITINENADPSVKVDITGKFNSLIPAHDNYTHIEGNADSHIKSTIVGQTTNLIIDNSRIVLGTWQGIFFCEFDGPRNRKVYIKLING